MRRIKYNTLPPVAKRARMHRVAVLECLLLLVLLYFNRIKKEALLSIRAPIGTLTIGVTKEKNKQY